jgi:endothelin-converting enzyme
MAQLVGFQTNHPNEGDPKELSEYYAGLPVTDDYFENGLAFSKFRRTNFWANLFTSYNRDNLTLQPVDYRPPNIPFAADLYVPFYVSRLNMIDVPAGTMQMPRFHVDIPEYVTYAAWGSTIVREIIEGLYGFKQYRGLLDNSTSARFEQESECFASQYKQYIAEDFKGRNRTRDRIEDEWAVDVLIEDQQSLRITYQAWRARSNSTQHNPRLPGLHEFTNDQLFFINFANSLCGKSKGEMPVNYKRIMATLPASVDFRKAFSCPAVKQAACEL